MLDIPVFNIPHFQIQWDKLLDEVAAAIGILVFVAGTTKSLGEYSQGRSSLTSRRDTEVDRAGELARCYSDVTHATLPSEHTQLLQQELHSRLAQCVELIQQLNLKLAEGARDPLWQVGFWRRAVLWFRPLGWRGYLLHSLFYFCALAIVVSGSMAFRLRQDTLLLWALMAAVFTVIFHYWALDERRRQSGYRKKLGRINHFLLIQAPETGRMLLAQLFFFMGATLTLAFLTDAIIDWPRRSADDNVGAILGLLVTLMYTSIFHGWARAELDYWQQKPKLISSFHAMSKGLFRHMKLSAWPKVKFIFSGLLSLVVALGFLIMAILAVAGGSVLGALLFGAVGWLVAFIVLYPSSRTVRIRYAVAEQNGVTATAQAAATSEAGRRSGAP